MMRMLGWGSLLAIVLSACGESEARGPVSPVAETAAPPARGEPIGEPSARGVALHEWGLFGDVVDRAPSERIAIAAGAPRIPSMGLGLSGIGAAGGKPVIYLHLADGVDEARLRVSVGARGVTFFEEFPTGQADAMGGTMSWDVIARRRSPCVAELPSAGSSRCSGIADGYCEAAELSDYATADAACLEVGGVASPLLFYRASAAADLPVSVARREGSIAISARADEAPSELWLVERGATSDATRAYVLAPPGSAETVVPADGTAPESARETLRGDVVRERFAALVRGSGLTEDESRAFLDAWQIDLFGPRPGEDARVPVGSPPAGLRPARRGLLYVMPAASVDRILPLRTEPAARELHRFFVARVTIEPDPAGGPVLRPPLGTNGPLGL